MTNLSKSKKINPKKIISLQNMILLQYYHIKKPKTKKHKNNWNIKIFQIIYSQLEKEKLKIYRKKNEN